MRTLIMSGVAAIAVVASVSAASAEVVCNRDGDCWRVKDRYVYKPEWGLKVHKDKWHWKKKHDDRYRWRDAGAKRGYWSKGVWIEF